MAKATLILGHYYHETFVRDFSLLSEIKLVNISSIPD